MSYTKVKRFLDILISLFAITILAPLFVVLALLVKVSSAGPVLFKQERVGRDGRSFNVLKFRSMKVDMEGSEVTALGDARITPVGAVLRRFKLDELPQFLNVLVGDMSLVGPRPEVPQFVAHYPDEIRTQVLSVRPGITDLASIRFVDEEKILAASPNPNEYYVREILPRKLACYCDYVEKQSFLFDLGILCKTVSAVAKRRASG